MIPVVLTREDANSESATLLEWLADDGAEVRRGETICAVETTKATVEIEAPAAGWLLRLWDEGDEVELGRELALIAESAGELEALRERRERERSDAPAATAAAIAGAAASGRATRKAVELAARHGIDLSTIEKTGFITTEDVEEAVLRRAAAEAPGEPSLLAGVSTDGVSLPWGFVEPEAVPEVSPELLARIRADPDAFRELPSEEKVELYRRHGAAVGRDVVLEEGVLVDAPRMALGDGVRLGRGATIVCAEAFAVGALTAFGPGLEIRCRRAAIGENVHGGRSVRFGGGGHRDPWALLAVGDLAFLGDEIFVNVCRPVLIGRETFVTMRSMIVTHNIGHSVLEGYENRFAPVVLEDLAQLGLAAIVYAGCRIGRGAVVGSGSYVITDIPPGAMAIGVPAKASGHASRTLGRAQQVALARRLVDDLHELLALRGHAVRRLAEAGVHGLAVEDPEAGGAVVFAERFSGGDPLPETGGETVVLALEFAGGELPAGCAVLDLLAKELHGEGGILLDSVRELCRKRGIRFAPGPWRYRGGLV